MSTYTGVTNSPVFWPILYISHNTQLTYPSFIRQTSSMISARSARDECDTHFSTTLLHTKLQFLHKILSCHAMADSIHQCRINNYKCSANAKRPCDCGVLRLRLKNSLCSCAHSTSDATSFGCCDQCSEFQREKIQESAGKWPE